MSQPILSCKNLRRVFRMGDSDVHVLKGVDLDVAPGEFIAIEGRSGSGKSTLLHVLGTLDEPTQGDVNFDGRDLFRRSAAERAKIRNVSFGFVFQFYYLLPELNVMENALLGAMVKHSWFDYRKRKAELRSRAEQVLGLLNLSHRLTHRPSQLSGGERQRVAIARA
ncbi:MAG TPA: ATP-binding cassette domain-containing protein, partial [Tepidisphaeraceae bacterium]